MTGSLTRQARPRAQRRPVGPRSRAPLPERIARRVGLPQLPPLVWSVSPLTGVRWPFPTDVCWPWVGAYSQKRRGRRPAIQVGGRGTSVVAVLRVTLWLHAGGQLEDYDALEACHGPCENLACVNPWHAYWGTPDENREDRVARTGSYFGRKAADLQLGDGR